MSSLALAASPPVYRRHRPEQTALYAIIAEQYPRFLRSVEASGGHLPAFVRQDFEDYLKCGLLEHGFQRVKCDGCRHEHLVVSIGGFSLNAGTVCEPWQRSRLERLCRYITRPPIATKRLSVDAQGRVVYRYKRPFRDGSAHVVLEPLDFMARLASLVPRPRLNLTRFHGVFAPDFRYLHRVVPRHPKSRVDSDKPLAPMSWAQRLKRVFAIDVEACPDCGGKLRVIASVEEPALIRKILGHVRVRDELGGVEARAPPVDQAEEFKLN